MDLWIRVARWLIHFRRISPIFDFALFIEFDPNSPLFQKSRRRLVYLMLLNAIVMRLCRSFLVRPSTSLVSLPSSKFKFNAHSSPFRLFVMIGLSLSADGRRAAKLSAFWGTVMVDGDVFTKLIAIGRFDRQLTGRWCMRKLSSSSSSSSLVSQSLSIHSVWFLASFKNSPALEWVGSMMIMFDVRECARSRLFLIYFTKHRLYSKHTPNSGLRIVNIRRFAWIYFHLYVKTSTKKWFCFNLLLNSD